MMKIKIYAIWSEGDQGEIEEVYWGEMSEKKIEEEIRDFILSWKENTPVEDMKRAYDIPTKKEIVKEAKKNAKKIVESPILFSEEDVPEKPVRFDEKEEGVFPFECMWKYPEDWASPTVSFFKVAEKE